VLARNPGALRNGAPSKEWVLPAALERVRHRFVIAAATGRWSTSRARCSPTACPAVEAACAAALAHGVHSADVVLNIVAPTDPVAGQARRPGFWPEADYAGMSLFLKKPTAQVRWMS
jgi:hypothetical protein